MYTSAEIRCISRPASRTHSRAPSPALSMRSRASRRKQRSPTPSLPSSDADFESEPESDRGHREKKTEKRDDRDKRVERQRGDRRERNLEEMKQDRRERRIEDERDDKGNQRVEDKMKDQRDMEKNKEDDESGLGPAPPPPSVTWQCEHCTFVNEPGVRVCVVCCRTPTITPKMITSLEKSMKKITVGKAATPSPVITRKVINTGTSL